MIMTEKLFEKENSLQFRSAPSMGLFVKTIVEITEEFKDIDLTNLSLTGCLTRVSEIDKEGEINLSNERKAIVIGNDNLGIIGAFSSDKINNSALGAFIGLVLSNLEYIEKIHPQYKLCKALINQDYAIMSKSKQKYFKSFDDDYVDDENEACKFDIFDALNVLKITNKTDVIDVIVPIFKGEKQDV
jgi:hypothetical protein